MPILFVQPILKTSIGHKLQNKGSYIVAGTCSDHWNKISVSNISHHFTFGIKPLAYLLIFQIENCCAEFEIIRENINAKNKTTDLRGSPINWLRPREEREQFYYGEAKTELQNRVSHSVYI